MIVTVLNDTRYENHHGCSRVMNCIDRHLHINNIKSVNYIPLLKKWSLDENIKRQIIKSDLIIINGEGTLHGNKSHIHDLLSVIAYVKNFNIRVGIINATIFDVNNDSLNLIRQADFIYLRDRSSIDYLKSNQIHAEYCPDLVFWNLNNFDDNNVSRAIELGYSDGMCFRPDSPHSNLSRFKAISIFNSNQAYNSYRLRRKLLYKFKCFFLEKNISLTFDNHVDFINNLLNYKFIITGRYHLVCFCLGLCIPFKFVESNTPKITYLLSDIGLDINNFRFNNDLSYRDFNTVEKEKISIFINKSNTLIEEMFKNILNY